MPEQSKNLVKSPDLLKDELGIILGKFDELSLTPRVRAFKYFRFYSKLRQVDISKFKLRNKFVILLVLFAAWFLHRSTSDYLENLRFRKCLVDQPSIARHVFRPIEDCSICEELEEIEKLSNVDQKLFEERYAYSGRPVVITDATLNWTAVEAFSFSFFKKLYNQNNGYEANCQFFPYRTEFHSLQEVLNMSTSRALLQTGTKPWYVGWSNCDQTIGAILRNYYQRPYFLPETAESEKTDWIFMGSPGYGAPMHIDDVKYPSWQAQIRGHKTWTLEPPRECHYKCKKHQVTVNPGEIIVLDTNKWYHQTLIVSDDISITIGAEYD